MAAPSREICIGQCSHDPTAGTLALTFFQAGEQEAQRALVEQLTDVTYQIRYTLKEH